MQIKTGDLVRIRIHSHTNELHKPHEIWLVLDLERAGRFKGFIRIQNIHNGHIVQHNEGMLMKIETDKK